MKFGKHIQKIQRREWAGNYMSYKDLKKIINNINNLEGGKSYAVTITAPNPPGTEEKLSKEMADLKTSFFFRLECELEKVNKFYLQKESEYKLRLQNLIEIKKISDSKKNHISEESLINLASLFHYFLNDIIKLQEFVEVNGVGFRKILKKWDKRTKSITKDMYLARQVEIQPCFNRTVLNEMSETATFHLNELKQCFPEETDIDSFPSQSLKSSSVIPPKDNLLYNYEKLIVRLMLSGKVDEMKLNLKKVLPLIDNANDDDFYNRVFLRLYILKIINIFIKEIQPQTINFNYSDKIKDQTCLHLTAINNQVELMKFCVEHQADIYRTDIFGRIPLHYVAMNGDIKCTNFLIQAANNQISSPLSIKSTKSEDIFDDIDQDGYSPLLYAIVRGHSDCLRILLENYKNFDSFCSLTNLYHPLSLASEYGHKDVILTLLDYNVKEEMNSEGLYPLHIACRLGHTEIAKILINHGSDVNVLDKDNGWTPIFYCCVNGYIDCVKVLLESNCKTDIKDDNGWYPLTYAYYHGHIKIAQLLSFNKKIHLFSNIENDENLDIDSLPPLSLPPPLIPFKLYGHNYLEKKIYLLIKLENFTDPNQSPLTIYGTQNFCSLRLIIRTNPECGIPYDIILPQKPDDNRIMTFFIDKNQDINLEIKVDRAFSNQLIGKAVIHSSRIKQIINYGRGDGTDPIEQCTVSLMDSHLHVIGKLSMKIFSVSPFSHPALEIGGKVQTYWKSTATTKLVNKSNQEIGSLSFITASSLTDEYILLPIQLTKDGVPVVCNKWYINYHDLKFEIYNITFEQFKFFGEKIMNESDSKDKSNTFKNSLIKASKYESIEHYTNLELVNLIYKSFLSLEEILKTLSHRIGINIVINYPTESVKNKLNVDFPFNINKTIDIILTTIYNFGDQRNFIFTSFNPFICISLKWKQPNFIVFFGTCCGFKVNHFYSPNHLYCDTSEQEDIQTEKICTSLSEAITFAKDNNLIGIICEVTPLIERPILINTIKESGLFLATFGKGILDPESVKLQEKLGVDAVILDEQLKLFR
ncbi:hypothetical protein BCR32DRAFT_230679 [Anaeromyces robustus]|uniref:Ankyrin n=1 Tax=Anaeromyces robustus TaxID=1754192 RepID=A0A1Y1XEI3_9FUNG|nr:hypothetical protein BCR32DRAFT_230679 [Anaeromyces robustus]|eukprot:ORX84117.1 hypothetical protein BCR32DRAFT_230679 [Anaeromyces robustus]